MTRYDVFNGDADGIASLVQLRLAHPHDCTLVTGPKRDIRLVERVPATTGDEVVVLDVALDENRPAVERLLARGVRVEYFDHHYAGDTAPPAGLIAHLDPSPGVCTGILVDRHLGGAQRIWAVVAALGDNLAKGAHALAAPLSLGDADLRDLHALADSLTYNTYGDRDDDAIVAPEALFRALLAMRDPLAFVREDPLFTRLDDARRHDMDQALALPPTQRLPGARLYILPDAAWARRVRGILGNDLARQEPTLAHAILTPDGRGDYAVSVRAPRARPAGADALCRRFPGGGGRLAAGGIGSLPPAEVERFVACLDAAYPGAA